MQTEFYWSMQIEFYWSMQIKFCLISPSDTHPTQRKCPLNVFGRVGVRMFRITVMVREIIRSKSNLLILKMPIIQTKIFIRLVSRLNEKIVESASLHRYDCTLIFV